MNYIKKCGKLSNFSNQAERSKSGVGIERDAFQDPIKIFLCLISTLSLKTDFSNSI